MDDQLINVLFFIIFSLCISISNLVQYDAVLHFNTSKHMSLSTNSQVRLQVNCFTAFLPNNSHRAKLQNIKLESLVRWQTPSRDIKTPKSDFKEYKIKPKGRHKRIRQTLRKYFYDPYKKCVIHASVYCTLCKGITGIIYGFLAFIALCQLTSIRFYVCALYESFRGQRI